jgi:hypothetical protein
MVLNIHPIEKNHNQCYEGIMIMMLETTIQVLGIKNHIWNLNQTLKPPYIRTIPKNLLKVEFELKPPT